jgi:hypothetical protein
MKRTNLVEVDLGLEPQLSDCNLNLIEFLLKYCIFKIGKNYFIHHLDQYLQIAYLFK